MENLINEGVTNFISGGALGFDQLAASLIISKKETQRKIRLIFALPCKGQDKYWSEEQKRAYRAQLSTADEIVYVSQEYDGGCMDRRNRYMVGCSVYCLCAMTRSFGGTARTVRYASEEGLTIINIGEGLC